MNWQAIAAARLAFVVGECLPGVAPGKGPIGPLRPVDPMLYLASPCKSRHTSHVNAAWLALVRPFGTVCQTGTADAAPG
jgi:hypothetical protein